MSAAWFKKLQQASKLLTALSAQVDAALRPEKQTYRRIPAFATLEFRANYRDYTQMERSWFNGAEDVFLQGVCAVVSRPAVVSGFEAQGAVVVRPDETSPALTPADAGYVVDALDDSALNDYVRIFYDFGWNFRTSRTGSDYLSSANTQQLLSSTILRKQRRDNYLWFPTPQKVKAGETLIGVVKPYSFGASSVAGDIQPIDVEAIYAMNVALVFFGYREGALHGGDL